MQDAQVRVVQKEDRMTCQLACSVKKNKKAPFLKRLNDWAKLNGGITQSGIKEAVDKIQEAYLDKSCIRLKLDGLLLTTIPPLDGVSQLDSLSLCSNKLSKLQEGDFEGLTNLHCLHLSNNQLSEIATGSFKGLTKLNELLLDDNKLGNLNAGTFKYLRNLSVLSLQTNVLTTLEPGTFAGLTNLQALSLQENKLIELHESNFKDVRLLKMMFLQDNLLDKLSSSIFKGMNELQVLELDGNYLEDSSITALYSDLHNDGLNVDVSGAFTQNKLADLSDEIEELKQPYGGREINTLQLCLRRQLHSPVHFSNEHIRRSKLFAHLKCIAFDRGWSSF